MDKTQNFVVGLVKTAPSPATSGTSLVIDQSYADYFPDPSTFGAYNLVIWNRTGLRIPTNCEVVRVTAKTDTSDGAWTTGEDAKLTITRAQESSTALSVEADFLIYMSGTGKLFDDIETALGTKEVTSNKVTSISGSSTDTQYPSAKLVYDQLDLKANLANTRMVLTANRTYYVRTDGSDSNDGLSNTSGGAFLTIQKALDTVGKLDLSIYDITIQVANGTYTGANVLKSFIGAGTVTVQGNTTTPASCIISVTGDDAFTSGEAFSAFSARSISGKYIIQGFKVTTTTSGKCFYAEGTPTIIELDKIEFGASVGCHIGVTAGGFISLENGTFTISGGSEAHFQTISGGAITANHATYTISGTPNFSVAFYWADRALGSLSCFGSSFTGSATGKRYQVAGNAVCFTNGSGTSFFPGSIAGTTATGGQYL